MRLRHHPLQVVDELFAAVFGVLVMPSQVDRLFRADLLAIAAEDAAELIDLEHERIPIAILVLTRNELDAVRWTYRRTQTAGDALRFAVFGREHAMCAAPARRERPLLLRILVRDLLAEDVRQREAHAFERRAHVTGLRDRPLEHLRSDGHQSASPSLVAGSKRARSNRARRSLSRLRLSRRE